jgi:hypothetical protein
MNAVRVIAGPGQPVLMGDRFEGQVADGGAQYIHASAAGTRDEWWFRGGLAFGLTEDWEAGALFVPVQFAPDLRLSNVTVFVTRGLRFPAWELGFRFSFQSPSLKTYEASAWNLNPGLPVAYHAGPFRLDAGVYVPIASRDWVVGLNVPVRATLNATPRFFFALESGLVEPRFDRTHDELVPLSVLGGYTELFGSRLVDFTATFGWDSFLRPSPAPDTRTFDLRQYRVGFGFTVHLLVR